MSEENSAAPVQTKNERNAANNAKNLRVAADIAAKTDNPYAKAIGTAVQAADKISGGKATEKLGKVLNTANKLGGIQGRMMQAGLNKMAESGATDKIGEAANKMNSEGGPKTNGMKSANTDKKTKTGVKDKSDEQSSDSSSSTFASDFKVVKYGLIGLAVMFPIIFCGLFIGSIQTYVNAIDLGTADSLSDSEVEEKINTKGTDGLDEEKDDDDLAYDIYISDSKTQIIKNNKLGDSNIVQIANEFWGFKKRKYNEATLDRLEDFYPAVTDLNKNYDENMVYDFFFKMYNMYTTYNASPYNVQIDLPLLMATLNLQSTDKNVIFSSNLDSRYRTNSVNDIPKNELDYNYDWSSYKTSKNNSEHDMEVLVQNSISKQVKESCVNSEGDITDDNILRDNEIGTQTLICKEGETYKTEDKGYVRDDVKYKKFLKSFLYKKYYMEGETSLDVELTEEQLNSGLVQDLIIQVYDSKNQYEDLAGDYEEVPTIFGANNSSYWWPIGSEETVEKDGKTYATGAPKATVITSNYGYRQDPFGRGTLYHSGIDIAANGVVNIVAAKDGIVVYPTKGVSNDCPSSNSLSSCGGGYGNYVIIQHSDGNYTLYAHMEANSIPVTAGESVEQGQVIGRMGSSGNSTGNHLHFEVREGQNVHASTVEPLNYISIENPRIVSSGGEFIDWLDSWEGHSPINGQNYVVEDIGDGVRTVGVGVTLEHNVSRFAKYGIDVDNYPVGSEIPIEIVDQIKLEEIESKRSSIEKTLSKNSIVLEETQIQALVSQMYNTGNIVGFVDNYKKYENTQELYENWFFRAIMKGTKFEVGLTRRRNAEWSLFHLGEYVYN